jgi:hypothetical protein
MKHLSRFINLLLAVSAFFLFISCASNPGAYASIDASIAAGSYKGALASLDNENSEARKNIYTSKNEILLRLDRGIIRHYAGEYRESSEDFQIAELLIEEAYTKSLTQSIGTYIANDNTLDYAGEDYEDLYINVFNALNYYHSGNLEGALVEIRRVNDKLLYLADRYERAKKKIEESDNGRVNLGGIPVEASSFSNSALARYLGVVFYRGTGRPDDARIDHQELTRAYGLAPRIYANPIPSSVDDELSVPGDMGRLNVIAFTGLSPVKVEETIIIPMPFDFPNNTAKIALPLMVDRPQSVQRAEAVLDNGQVIRLELIEDMGAVARETFKSRYTLTALKTAIRSVLKVTASAGLASFASESQGGLVGLLVGAAGRVAAGASESADTRLARYFPRSALVGGINLEPGNYSVTINYYGAGGLIHSEPKEIAVRRNAVNLVESFYLR